MTTGKRVLVVEDEAAGLLPSLYVMRERLGLHVDIAKSYQEASLRLEGERYDLIVIDIRIPSFNDGEINEFGGIELVERLHAGELGLSNKNSAYIFLTAQSLAVQDQRSAHDERCKGTFKKVRQQMAVKFLEEFLK